MTSLNKFKYIIKKYVPPRFIEILSHKAVLITKIPKDKSTISDLFILRIENGWKTSFECLQLNTLIKPDSEIKSAKVIFYFFSEVGKFLGAYNYDLPDKIKTSIPVGEMANYLGIKKDSLFGVFHPQINFGQPSHKSFLTERGYIGYENFKKGAIKGFVHGNLDAIAKSKLNDKYELLGNYSFFKKKYIFQHELNPDSAYEFYLVNPSRIKQKFKITEISTSVAEKMKVNIAPGGFFKYVKTVDKKGSKTNIIIESKLYLIKPESY